MIQPRDRERVCFYLGRPLSLPYKILFQTFELQKEARSGLLIRLSMIGLYKIKIKYQMNLKLQKYFFI